MNTPFFPFRALVAALLIAAGGASAEELYLPPQQESQADDVEIVVGADRTIFEYRVNGLLTMIKVVPKEGRPYYMVPADGSPHFKTLDHTKKLYPRWVILEW